MRIAFIDHVYHRKTGSSDILHSLVRSLGSIEHFSLDDLGGPLYSHWRRNFDPSRYDIIIVWQVHFILIDLPHRHPNVVFVPMYDALASSDGRVYWDDVFSERKIICFSRTLYREIEPQGLNILSATYFPDPTKRDPINDFDDLRGFFWYRRRQISPALIFRLTRNSHFAKFNIHNAPDPGHEAETSWPCPTNFDALTVSEWTGRNEDYRAYLKGYNVFFTPRLCEGIGMGFLEAMASGMCVVAPDLPTMNEYINKNNGLLYDPLKPQALDFSRARELGYEARQSIENGFSLWQRQIPLLLDFIRQPAGRPSMRSVSATAPSSLSGKNRFLRVLNALKRRWPAFGRMVGAGLAGAARFIRRG